MHSFELVEDKTGKYVNSCLLENDEQANEFFLNKLGYTLSSNEDTDEVKEYVLSSDDGEEQRNFLSTFKLQAQIEALTMLGYSVFQI